jgi:hypothetical protein
MVAFLEQTFDTVGHAPVNDMLYRLGCYSRHDRSHAQTMCEAGLMSIVIKEMLKDGSSSSGLYSVSRLLCGSLTGAQVDGLAKQFPNVFVGSLAQDFMYVVDKAEAVVKAVSKAKKVAKAEANALVRDKELELLRRKCAELEGLDMQITRALARISGYVSYSLLRVPVQDLFREALRDYEANGCAPKGSVSRSNIASIIQVLGRLKSDEPISTWLRLIRKALENVEQDRGQDGAQDGAQDGPQDGPQDGAQDCEQNNSAQEEEEEEAASKDILASAVDSLAFRMYSFYCDTPISSTSPTSSTLCVSKPSGADTAELGQLFVRVLQNPGATFATKHALANKMAYVIGKTSDELFSAICGPLVAFLKQTFETKGHGVVVDVMQQMLYVLSDRAEGRGERTAAILLKAGMGPVVVKEMLKNSKSTSNPQGTLRSMFVMLFKFVDDAQLFSISEQFPDLAARISERGASITSQQIAARIKAVRDKAEAVAEAVAKAVAGAEAKAEAEAKSKAKDEFAQELELLRRKCADFEGTVQHLRRKCADFEGTVQHFTQDKVKHMALAAIARDHFATEEAKLRSKCAKLKDTLKRVTALVAPNTDGAAPSDQTVLS